MCTCKFSPNFLQQSNRVDLVSYERKPTDKGEQQAAALRKNWTGGRLQKNGCNGQFSRACYRHVRRIKNVCGFSADICSHLNRYTHPKKISPSVVLLQYISWFAFEQQQIDSNTTVKNNNLDGQQTFFIFTEKLSLLVKLI